MDDQYLAPFDRLASELDTRSLRLKLRYLEGTSRGLIGERLAELDDALIKALQIEGEEAGGAGAGSSQS